MNIGCNVNEQGISISLDQRVDTAAEKKFLWKRNTKFSTRLHRGEVENKGGKPKRK